MIRWLLFLVTFAARIFRTRVALQLEVAALRHQLALYKEKGLRPRIQPADRLLWSLVSRWWPEWRRVLFIVPPRTVLVWQRKRCRDYWRELSRSARPGRPKIAPELRLFEAFPFDTAPRFLLREGDAKFGDKVRRRLHVMGIRELVTAPASPWPRS